MSLDWANLCPKTWLWPLQYKGGALPPLYSMGCFVGGDAQYVVFEGRDVEHQKFRYKQPSIQQVLLDRGLFVPQHFVLYSFPTKTTYTIFSFINEKKHRTTTKTRNLKYKRRSRNLQSEATQKEEITRDGRRASKTTTRKQGW